VIGDVIGHDLNAASAMSQVRSALRAYAVDGDPPREVINRLDHLVTVLGLTQLVTVVYGVLDVPDADGDRVFRFSNAGHLAPLLRHPDGRVESLNDGSSILIGAPTDADHNEAECRLAAGSTLLLFTDGLVEVPRRPLEETTDEVADALAKQAASLDLDALCDRVLATTSGRELRDDVALLAIRIDGDVPVVVDLDSDSEQLVT
jgi:serine phosphatase RsbU (regulator of sigma subunit)